MKYKLIVLIAFLFVIDLSYSTDINYIEKITPKGTYLNLANNLYVSSSNVGIGTNSPTYKLHVNGTFYADTVNTGIGNTEVYLMNQNVRTSDAVTFATVNTGIGATEVYLMNQNVRTTDAVSFATVNTGQGANELYAMNQNVRTTDTPSFAGANLRINSLNDTIDQLPPGNGIFVQEGPGSSNNIGWAYPYGVRLSVYQNTARNFELMTTGYPNGNIVYRQYDPTNHVWTSWKKLWSDYNDGSGSGLDADLLDGHDSSYFQAALTNPVTGTGTANYITKWTGTTSVGNSVIYETGGNVGIGTTSPGAKLDVAGTGKFTGALTVDSPADYDATAVTSLTSAPILVPEVNVGTTSSFLPFLHQKALYSSGYRTHMSLGLYKSTSAWGPGSTGFYVALGGNDNYPTEHFLMSYGGSISHSSGKITTSNNVGIGTTAPNAPLVVYGGEGTYAAPNFGSANRGAIHIRSLTSDRRNAITFSPAGTDSAQAGIYVHQDNSAGTHMYFATTNSYATGPQARMTILNSGNVGIGTTSPGQKLDIAGNIRIPNGNQLMSITSSGGNNYNLIHMSGDAINIGMWEGWYGRDLYLKGGNGNVIVDFSDGNNANFVVRKVAGSTPTELMRVTDSGNVGIGTTAPQTTLNVYKDYTFSSVSELYSMNPFPGQLILGDNNQRLYLGTYYNGGVYQGSAIQSSEYYNGADHWHGLLLNPNGGNVGIGTTSPSYKLHVAGNF